MASTDLGALNVGPYVTKGASASPAPRAVHPAMSVAKGRPIPPLPSVLCLPAVLGAISSRGQRVPRQGPYPRPATQVFKCLAEAVERGNHLRPTIRERFQALPFRDVQQRPSPVEMMVA